ncbi:MAG TPA: DUF3866 family protein [Actinomycetota bacterium]|nr:DUF3866 family protein [Actinomycetota bacterium]
MIRLRRATVSAVKGSRPGLLELAVEVDGRTERALCYPALTGPVVEGDVVLLNTTAVDLGLGTGGTHFVVAGPNERDASPGHVMKLRYTPLQAVVPTVEEQASPHHEAMARATSLDGLPVAWVPLHSMVAAAAAGARTAGAARVAYVMTDGAALPAWLSDQVAALRSTGIIEAVVTVGQALGGDLEAVNVFSGLLAARMVAGADAVIVADGPGKVGTATPWGASELASAMALNAAGTLGGRPIAALRLNFSDLSYRHHGISPHSLRVLAQVALVPLHVAIPVLPDERRDPVWTALREARLEERHQLVEVAGQPGVDLLRDRGIPMQTMGRTEAEEPEFFLAAGAAGVLAGRMAAGAARWRQERA